MKREGGEGRKEEKEREGEGEGERKRKSDREKKKSERKPINCTKAHRGSKSSANSQCIC